MSFKNLSKHNHKRVCPTWIWMLLKYHNIANQTTRPWRFRGQTYQFLVEKLFKIMSVGKYCEYQCTLMSKLDNFTGPRSSRIPRHRDYQISAIVRILHRMRMERRLHCVSHPPLAGCWFAYSNCPAATSPNHCSLSGFKVKSLKISWLHWNDF